MIQIFRSKKEFLVLKWDGKKETIDIINEKICSKFKGYKAYVGFTTNGVINNKILFINHESGNGIGNYYNIGEYIVIDYYFIENDIPDS